MSSRFWTKGRRKEKLLCISCLGPRTSKPLPHCDEPRHLQFHLRRRAGNNKLRRDARHSARAIGTVKRYGTPEAKKRQSKRYYQKARRKLIENLGGVCRRCSFPDARALEVHHKRGGGHTDRVKMGWRYHFYLTRMPVEKLRELFELLCANCHSILHREI